MTYTKFTSKSSGAVIEKITALIVLILFMSCNEEVAAPFSNNNQQPARIRLVIFAGESNSGGQALNRDATVEEKSIREGTFILNNNTLVFENLQVGVNNLIGHSGMKSDTIMHSWELQLANKEANGEFFDNIFIVKTGQGGSRIAQWDIQKSYADTFDKRLTAALNIFSHEGVNPTFAMFYSQGINDLIAADWNPIEWERKTIERFKYLREKYGHFPIIMTKFFNIPGRKVNELNLAIDNICSTVPDCNYVDTKEIPLDDKYHFNYQGQKKITDLMIDKLKTAGYFF